MIIIQNETEMGETFDFKTPNEGVKSIIIMDIFFKYNAEELISKIKWQIQQLLEHDIKEVKSFEYKNIIK